MNTLYSLTKAKVSSKFMDGNPASIRGKPNKALGSRFRVQGLGLSRSGVISPGIRSNEAT